MKSIILLWLLIILTPLYLNPYPVEAAENIDSTIYTQELTPSTEPPFYASIQVSASIGENRYSLYGYTSPGALVTIQGLGLYDQTFARSDGYYSFDNRFSPLSSHEACISAQDQLGRLTTPTCIPPFSVEKNVNIGPIILPPTVSFNKDKYYSGEEIQLTGQAIPNSPVDLSIFTDKQSSRSPAARIDRLITRVTNPVGDVEAYSLPELATMTDKTGNYSVSLKKSRPETLRVFSQTSFNKDLSPKSNTLYLQILPWWYIIITMLLWILNTLRQHLIEIILLLQIVALSIYLLRRLLHPYGIVQTRSLTVRAHRELSVISGAIQKYIPNNK